MTTWHRLLDAPGYSRMTEDVVWMDWLLNPKRPVNRKGIHVVNSLLDRPNRVGIHHQAIPLANSCSKQLGTTIIGLLAKPNFHLEGSEALCDGSFDELLYLLVRVSSP